MIEAERLVSLADGGDVMAQYVVGALYRLGKKHPARLFERDLDEAARYLSNAAINGVVNAMAGMAELRLVQENYSDAMVWAQVYTHYFKLEHSANEDVGTAYPADLLQRCFEAMERSSHDAIADEQISSYMNAFIDRHDGSIMTALNRYRDRQARTEPDPQETYFIKFGHIPIQRLGRNLGITVTLFRLSVNRDGGVEKVLMIDSLPDARDATTSRRLAVSAQYNPSPEATLRWVTLPIHYDDRSARLKSDRRH